MANDTDGHVLPLFEIDGPLAERLVAQLADRFLAGAGLSASHRDQAIAQTAIMVRVVEQGRSFELDFTLPLGSGNPSGYVWDGAVETAEQIADNAADRGIEDVLWDRENVGPTGWEPEFDDA
jgi:hypothetical protein